MQILGATTDLPRPDVEIVAGACLDGSLADVDLRVLVREFLNVATPDQSGLLLDSLFLVAAADGQLQDRELKLIREVARDAGFGEQAFRSSLQRAKQRLAAGWN